MRSHAAQLLRPLRAASSLQPVRACFVAPVPTSTFVRTVVTAPKPFKYRTNNTNTRPPPKDPKERVPDPQPAFVPPSTVSEVDPKLAAQIPTATSSTNSAPAFRAAIASSDTNYSGPEGGEAGEGGEGAVDWGSSFHGLATTRFSPEVAAVLMAPLNPLDIEMKPDGIVYLPEIKYRRILNQAFGPGGWGLAPRSETVVGDKVVTREYALIVHGRFVAQARGECQYFSEETIPTAGEGCKSNALMRCCKDLGIASELWDPRFIREFKKKHCHEIWVEHVVTKKRRQVWSRKDTDPFYPYVKSTGSRSV